jgi:hypothetical protein
MIGTKFATMKSGQNVTKQATEIPAASQEKAAEMVGVSVDSIQSARTVLNNGSLALQRAVENVAGSCAKASCGPKSRVSSRNMRRLASTLDERKASASERSCREATG